MPACPQLVRKVYFIYPMSPSVQEAEYRSFLERHNLYYLKKIVTLKLPNMTKEAFLKRTAPRVESQERPAKRVKAKGRECATRTRGSPLQVHRKAIFDERCAAMIKEKYGCDLDMQEVKAVMALRELEACAGLMKLSRG